MELFIGLQRFRNFYEVSSSTYWLHIFATATISILLAGPAFWNSVFE